MKPGLWITVLAAAAASFAAPAQTAVPEFAAELRGHAVLPATTTVSAPRNAPASLAVSGKYTGKPGERVERSARCRPVAGSRADNESDSVVKKVGYIHLMNIADPQGVVKRGGKAGRFTFPFVTIEDVDVVDSEHIIVANDNNYPYSIGRALGRQDDNEFILLRVPQLLTAK